MASVGMPVLLRINVTKENINSAYSIPEYINSFSDTEKSKVQVLIQQVWQDSQNDILDEIWGLYGEFLKIGIIPWPRRFNFYKHICYADIKNSAVINYNGKIFKCTAIDFDKKRQTEKLNPMVHLIFLYLIKLDYQNVWQIVFALNVEYTQSVMVGVLRI